MKKLFISLFFLGALAYIIYLYQTPLLHLVYYSPCDTPISYSVGQVDSQFNTTSSQFLEDIQEATAIWNTADGKTLFAYNPKGTLRISMIYDGRQSLTNQINNLDNQLQQEKNSLNPEVQQYQQMAKDFKQKIADLNNQIAYWNSKGGAPQDVYNQLTQEQKDLIQEEAQLNAMAQKINGSTDTYNERIGQLNQAVNTFNATLQTKPEEGVYNGSDNSIIIYFSSTHTELIHTLAHELGHSLGMQHVTGNNSIMYYQTDDALTPSANDLTELARVCAKRTIVQDLIQRIAQLKSQN